jgi:hypothetical protein
MKQKYGPKPYKWGRVSERKKMNYEHKYSIFTGENNAKFVGSS